MEKENLNLVIPEDMAEINIVGGAVTSTPFNIRLLVYNEEIERNGDTLNDTVKINRKGKAEIVMHPQVAKNLAELLAKEVENYQKKFID